MANSSRGVDDLQIDEVYEFCAPRFFDFINEETSQEIRRAELWFETSQSYAPSPFMPKIRESRTIQIESLCDLGSVDQTLKVEVPATTSNQIPDQITDTEKTTSPPCSYQQKPVSAKEVQDVEENKVENRESSFEYVSEIKPSRTSILLQKDTSSASSESTGNISSKEIPAFEFPVLPSSYGASVAEACTLKANRTPRKASALTSAKKHVTIEVCTPKTERNTAKEAPSCRSKTLKSKSIGNVVKQPSASKPNAKSPSVLQCSKSKKQKSIIKYHGRLAKNDMASEIAQENQAIKRQKLDDGRSRQILNIKNRVLPHKSKLGLAGGTMFSSGAKGYREERSALKEVTPFISAAEMVNKFQSRTRDLDLFQNRSLSHEDTASVIQRRPKLTLTRPKNPELETSHRVRAVRIKSTAELEEEMLAKIPKFKARPLNKKILEAPTPPPLPRSAPLPPVFQEFHFKTVERANQHAEISSVVSFASTSAKNPDNPCKLTEPRSPHLKTSLRARPPRIKSSQELELEELEKIPKFKARPLNKKVLDSKGEIGLFSSQKPQITIPQEFHFATDDRLGPPATVVDIFDKLSLHSESSNHEKRETTRITIPNPFHLQTDERGLEKERQLAEYILQKQLEEERARIPKANPYPYTTDYPVIPPKPEPKQCTRPEDFQLESLVRHEEEMQRKFEEKQRMEREEAQRRIFRAQPIIRDDPLPLPERERKPLTEVQEFALQVDNRAVQRSEFDKMIKEKELTYKRMRDEQEHAKMIEEEKAVKQMRRTMVPHAKPLPRFDHPFLPQKSTKETTKPKSPDLRVNHRGESRHALHMR